MNENSDDEECNDASSLHMDLSKLVVWAHSHGTICKQVPAMEFMHGTGHLDKDNAVLWMCKVGHAYHWQYGKSHDRGREGTGTVERRRRFQSSEALAREDNFGEKRLRLTPSSFERGQADSGSMESYGRSPGVVQQEAYTGHKKHREPSPRESQNTRKSLTSCSAAEQHLTARFQSGEENVKLENDDDLPIISEKKQCVADENNQRDRIKQNNVPEPPAHVDLQMHPCQKMTIHQPITTQRAAFAPMAGPPLPHACVLRSPVGNLEDSDRNMLKSGLSTATGPMAETSRERTSPGSAAPKVCFKPFSLSSTEAKAQLESGPLVTFFEFQATADVQQQLHLSPPEDGTLGMDSSENSTEYVAEKSKPLGSEEALHPSTLQSPESPSPSASNRDELKKQQKRKNCATGDIKVFKDWLMVHHPSETREIHMLPPEDLDSYLVSFFSSTKRQDGMDFSVNSFIFLQRSIKQYLKKHNYQYNMVRGLEFRASQEVWKLKYQHLCQKKREEELSVLENLTDEDVENLQKKGILSKLNPQGFLHLMFTSIVRGFGARTHRQSFQLYWGQLVLRKSKGEVECLEWKDDLSSEGNKGEAGPQLFAKPDDPENCPVTTYKEYAKRRPPDMLKETDPLYLAPKTLCSVWDKVWYSRKALAGAKIANILKVITQQFRGAVRKPREQSCPFDFAS